MRVTPLMAEERHFNAEELNFSREQLNIVGVAKSEGRSKEIKWNRKKQLISFFFLS